MADIIITNEGLKKLKEELDYLKNVKRKELIERIQRAKELGDLSENADYADAKEEQGFVEGRIQELENLLVKAVVVENNNNKQTVNIHSKIKLKTNNNVVEYTITGFNEADPAAGKISNESPLGKELMGKKIGDEVEITTPKGKVKYKILEIS
jgi:transcription elongation factor GreA